MAIGRGEAFLPQLLLMLPFLVLAGIGFRTEKTKQYRWWYVIVGVVVISAVRFYETDIVDMITAYL